MKIRGATPGTGVRVRAVIKVLISWGGAILGIEAGGLETGKVIKEIISRDP